MTDNFQDGVGKKIVEALKQQDDNGAGGFDSQQQLQPQSNTFNYDMPVENTEFSSDIQNQLVPDAQEKFTEEFETIAQNSFAQSSDMFSDTQNLNFQGSRSFADNQFAAVNSQKAVPQNSSALHMPPNVAVLRRLIAQLPNGVTKQTGAQIIRQTMEALGISMNNVLHEAQQVQDGLNDSVKTCMYSIQEYKNNIKQLEKQVLDYQKQIAYLNDLISLFVMTDKTR